MIGPLTGTFNNYLNQNNSLFAHDAIYSAVSDIATNICLRLGHVTVASLKRKM